MNWKEIKENYPNAFNKCVEEHINSEFGEIDIDARPVRDLYDFLDGNNIIIELGVDYTMEPKYCYKVSKYIETEIDWVCPNWSDLYYTRVEAETAAFTKAFEILEQKL